MPFQLISSKQCGAELKVIFQITRSKPCKYSSETNETDVNVHDVAVITFKQTSYIDMQIIEIKTKKTQLAKDLTVTVTFSKGDANIKFTCSDEWSEFKLFTSENNDTLKYPYVVNIKLNVSRVRTIQAMLHDDTSFTDFELSADDGTVPVHKAVLAAHSDIFKTMLLGSWKETTEGRLTVDGVNRETLHQLKEYFYLGTLPDRVRGLQALLLIAMRYLIEVLKVECLFKISKMVTEDNLHDLLKFAIENDCDELLRNLLQKTPDAVVIAAFNKKRPTRDSAAADTD